MAKVDLTAQRLRELLSYDAETGLFTNRVNRGNIKAGFVIGDRSNHPGGYCQIGIDGKVYFAHRLVWLHENGKWPLHHIDHIDGDRTNNRISNLRDVPLGVNNQNVRRATLNNKTTGVLGVRTQGNRFRADISVDGRSVSLGCFDTPEEAHQAYLVGKRLLHPGCAI